MEAHTIPATNVHHDHRGDFGIYQVERSGPSYLSTVTTLPASKPTSFSVPVVKPSRFQQHNEVFNRVNGGLELGSPKVSIASYAQGLLSLLNFLVGNI